MAAINHLWLVPEDGDKWKLIEELFSLPVEQRAARLLQLAQEAKIEHLGTTDKTAPEIATEMIKKGVRAKSFSVPKKPLTKNK